ncbi:MAG: SLOG family protein, partial [Clostridia bacterium]|nr:SLOG family protein [Clostridia bacterium]
MPNIDKEKSCCFFGHRKIDETEELKNNLYEIIENLIVNEKVDTFLFGSKSQFDDLCHEIVTDLKEKYSHIKRIYVRSAFQHIPDWYEDSLLKRYEGTYFPEHMENAGNASYVERNQEMINHSKYCIVYYDENYLPPRGRNGKRDLFDYQPKSGTAVAYSYAITKKKTIINTFENKKALR